MPDFSSAKVVYSVEQENPSESGFSIKLALSYGDGGTGKIKLLLNVDASKVKSVQAEWRPKADSGAAQGNASSKTSVFTPAADGSVTTDRLSSSEEDFPSGAYELTLYFWSGVYDESTKSGGTLLYAVSGGSLSANAPKNVHFGLDKTSVTKTDGASSCLTVNAFSDAGQISVSGWNFKIYHSGVSVGDFSFRPSE